MASSNDPLVSSIKLKSSSAYESLYNSGIIQLPYQRTIRDYTHVIKPCSGFSNDMDEQIGKEAKLEELEEWQKHVVLIFDEMHIKEDLIFDKITGQLKGFTNLGNINDHLLNLETNSGANSDHNLPNLANSMLVFMVRGIYSLIYSSPMHSSCAKTLQVISYIYLCGRLYSALNYVDLKYLRLFVMGLPIIVNLYTCMEHLNHLWYTSLQIITAMKKIICTSG